jgi:hypothetical protein
MKAILLMAETLNVVEQGKLLEELNRKYKHEQKQWKNGVRNQWEDIY